MTVPRRILAIVALWIPVAVIALTGWAWRGELPAQLPSHWGASGPADGATDGSALFAWLTAVGGGAAAGGTIAALVRAARPWSQRAAVAVLAAVAAGAACMWLTSAAGARGVADPLTVELGARGLLLFAWPVYALIPLVLLPKPAAPHAVVAESREVAPMELGPDDVVAWSRTVTSPMFAVVAIVMVALGAVLFGPPLARGEGGALNWGFAVYLIGIVIVALFASFRVSVDWRGLRVSSTLLGIPLQRVAPAQVVDARATELVPMEWGGWGYRITPGRSAIVLGSGPGLVVTKQGGTQFAISLRDPEQPAAILRALAEREQDPAES